MTAAALWVVGKYGSNLPWMDDCAYVPYLTGTIPTTAQTLWDQHTDHRIFLARVCYLGLFALTHNLKAVMFFDVVLLSGLAAAALRTARQLRGRTRLADAFVPLMCLSWAHLPNLLWAFQVCFFLTVVLARVALLAMLRDAQAPTLRTALWGGGAVALLPLTCGVGVLLAPPLTVWLLASAVRSFRLRPRRTGTALVNAVCALTAWGLIALYLHGLTLTPPPEDGLAWGNLQPVWACGERFLAGGFGFSAVRAWPYSGVAAGLVFLLVPLLVGHWAWRYRAERLGAGVVLLFLAAGAAFLVVLFRSRGSHNPAHTGFWADGGFTLRYLSLPLPGYLAVFLGLVLFDRRVLSRIGQGTLCALALCSLFGNIPAGLQFSRVHRSTFDQFQLYLAAGAPSRVLAHHFPLCFGIETGSEGIFCQLKEAGLFHLEGMPIGYEGGVVKVIPLSASVVRRRQTTWAYWPEANIGVHGFGEVRGDEPSLVFQLAQPRYVHALRFKRLHWNLADGADRTRLRVFWKNGSETFSDQARNGSVEVGFGESETVVWMDAVVDAIRLDPADLPCCFLLSEMSLVVSDREGGKELSASGRAPCHRWVPFSAVPVRRTQTTWEMGDSAGPLGVWSNGQVSGQTPSVVLRLAEKRYVHALRFKACYWALADGGQRNRLRVFWKDGSEAFTDPCRSESIEVSAAGVTDVMVLVDAVVDEIRLDPANLPCSFAFTQMSLAVPAGSKTGLDADEQIPYGPSAPVGE
jgi:hypothetical protein